MPDNVRLTYLVTVTLVADAGAEALLTPDPLPVIGGIADIVRDGLDEAINRNESMLVENLDDGNGRVRLDRVIVTEARDTGDRALDRHLHAAIVTNADAAADAGTPTMHVATVTTEEGATFFVNRTERGLTHDLAKWCRDLWQQERIPGKPPQSDTDTILRYFMSSDTDTLYRANTPETIGE